MQRLKQMRPARREKQTRRASIPQWPSRRKIKNKIRNKTRKTKTRKTPPPPQRLRPRPNRNQNSQRRPPQHSRRQQRFHHRDRQLPLPPTPLQRPQGLRASSSAITAIPESRRSR